MKPTAIVILVLFIIWIVILFIIFLLAYFYKISHIGFKEKRNLIIEALHEEFDLVNIDIEQNEIEFEIDFYENEKFLCVDQNIFFSGKYNKRLLKKIDNEITNNVFYLFFDAFHISGHQKLIQAKKIIITNIRIIIDLDYEFLIIPFIKINKIYYSLMNYKKIWYYAIYIITDKKIYKITINKLNFIKILKSLYKKNNFFKTSKKK